MRTWYLRLFIETYENLSIDSFDALRVCLARTSCFPCQNELSKPLRSISNAFQDGARTDQLIFEWFNNHPKVLDNFNTFMSTHFQGRADWLNFFPVDEELIQGFHDGEGAVMFVDVGGALGTQIQALIARYPTIPGRMVLQDLPDTIKRVTATNMEAMTHDFFTPHPVQGSVQCPYSYSP